MSSVAPALLPFRLQEHAPLAAEAVELVQKEAAEIGLQRLIDVGDRHSLFQRLVSIHIGVDLRDVSGEL